MRPTFESHPANSKPDVCVRIDGKRIGIEATRAVNQEAAVFDSYVHTTLRAAGARHRALQGLPGRVTVSFHSRADLRAVDRNQLGGELAEVVNAHWVDGEQLVIGDGVLSSSVSRYVREVRAFPSSGVDPAFWNSSVSAWVRGLSAEFLQPIIDKKNDLLGSYRSAGCDEYWLLIYARVGKTAEMFDVDRGFDASTLTSAFDRTFFFDYFRSIELAI